MNRNIITSSDGSSTIYVEELDEHFHSVHGAYTESMHVFIKKGLYKLDKASVSILEIGFGTGLNALLTYVEQHKMKRETLYHAIELYPLSEKECNLLNHKSIIGEEFEDVFTKMHYADWNIEAKLTDSFILKKIKDNIATHTYESKYDLIYFDAFAPNKQPELWSKDIFLKMYNCLNNGGLLTTYCAKGEVRRTMQSVGFTVERTDGPPGKREMLIAYKH